MQAKLFFDMDGTDGQKKPAGAIIDHPDAHWLVQMGCAEPVDEECREKAAMTPEALASAKHAYRRLAAGIHPGDFAAFDAGEMAGYNPDGSWKPGPNAELEPVTGDG